MILFLLVCNIFSGGQFIWDVINVKNEISNVRFEIKFK